MQKDISSAPNGVDQQTGDAAGRQAQARAHEVTEQADQKAQPASADRIEPRSEMSSRTGSGRKQRRAEREERRRDYRPEGVDPRRSRFGMLKGIITEFSEDNMSDWAAALTYYGLLAMFPALIALVAIIGLVGDPATTTRNITEIVTKIGPKSAAETFAGPIKSVTSHKGAAGVLLIVGLLGALYSASSYVGAFMRASNVIFETPEGRPFWKLRPLQVLVTLLMLLMVVFVAVALVLTGPIVNAVAGPLGLSSAAVSAWNIAKWPVLVLVVVAMFTILFYAAPNVRLRGLRWVAPGAAFALVVWLIASVAFAFYVANFGSYDKTYGTLGGMVAFLVWMWITNVALLLGMELNAERERNRELDEGVQGAERELQLDPRSEPKTKKTT